MSKNRNKKNVIHFKPGFYWMFAFIFSLIFIFFFCTADMIPNKWKLIAVVILAVILLITGVLSFRDVIRYRRKGIISHKKHTALKVINILFAIIMAACSILFPYYETRITNMINTNNKGKNTIKMNVYVMSDAYKAEHSDLFNSAVTTSFSNSEDELKSYAGSNFITELTVDPDYQREAVKKIESLLGSTINVSDKTSIQEAAAALYSNEAPVMIMNSSYAAMLEDTTTYESFDSDTRVIYTIELNAGTNSELSTGDTDLTSKPFAVFIGGNDEEGELSLTGRTDVDMVLVVNPTTYQIGIFSYPRDCYVPNPALSNGLDKLTHLGVSGLDNTMQGLENILGVDVNNYVLLNFTTYREIIDAIGGVDIYNPYTFNWDFDDHHEFTEGNLHLDGVYALEYVRERHNLPDGDFGRTMHQQIVMKAILEKVTSASMLIHFDSLITALKGTFLTNISSDAIYSFMQYQLDKNISWNIVNYRAEGDTDNAICASAPSEELSVVLPYANQLTFMTEQAQAIMNGKTVTQQEMPEGNGVRWKAIHGGQIATDDSEWEVPQQQEYYPQQNYTDNQNNNVNTYTEPSQPVETTPQQPQQEQNVNQNDKQNEATPTVPDQSQTDNNQNQTGTETVPSDNNQSADSNTNTDEATTEQPK